MILVGQEKREVIGLVFLEPEGEQQRVIRVGRFEYVSAQLGQPATR